MLISVIIPHLNQEAELRTGLAALHAQKGGWEAEIIVVDNGSRRLPEAVCAEWPKVRLTAEPEPGPGPARNRGAGAARGDVLAFIDADCRAHPEWLDAIATAFADPEAGIIGGEVLVDYRDPDRPSPIEPYEAIYSYRNDAHIAEGYSGAGNMAVRREVFDRVGPFGGIDISEDRDWGLRAGRLGHRTRYVPEMIVYHPARPTFADLARKWDRHIAHDYEAFAKRRFGGALWLGKAAAVAGSPVFELPTVLRSPKVGSGRERWLAWRGLTQVRLYRARRMIATVLGGDSAEGSRRWNRD